MLWLIAPPFSNITVSHVNFDSEMIDFYSSVVDENSSPIIFIRKFEIPLSIDLHSQNFMDAIHLG